MCDYIRVVLLGSVHIRSLPLSSQWLVLRWMTGSGSRPKATSDLSLQRQQHLIDSVMKQWYRLSNGTNIHLTEGSVRPSAGNQLYIRGSASIMMSSASPKTLNTEQIICWWWSIWFKAGKTACSMGNIVVNQKLCNKNLFKKPTKSETCWSLFGVLASWLWGQWRPLVMSINHQNFSWCFKYI